MKVLGQTLPVPLPSLGVDMEVVGNWMGICR